MGDNDDGTVRIHVLKLHESPVVDGDNYDRFHMMWLIDDSSGPPKIPENDESCDASNDKDSTLKGKGVSSEVTSEEWNGINFGDLFFFPELQTGAGEFEGLRFAGERSVDLTDNHIPLLVPGIENVEFPPDIVYMADKRGMPLRNMYEGPIERILGMQAGGMTLADLYGGSDVVEEFWSKPDVMRRRTPLASESDKWIIPLSGCTLIRTESFEIGKQCPM